MMKAISIAMAERMKQTLLIFLQSKVIRAVILPLSLALEN